MAKQFENQYFLFGGKISEIFYCEGFKKAVKAAKNGEDFTLFCWDEQSTPTGLLTEFNGNDDFAVLTEKEYKEFLAIE